MRSLIANAQKPVGSEEFAILRATLAQEKELRITAENDVARLRQNLSDEQGGSHRDIINLKKALSDM